MRALKGLGPSQKLHFFLLIIEQHFSMVRRPIDGNVMYAPVRSTAPFEVDTADGDDDAAAEAAVHAPTGLGGRFAPHVHAPSSSASSSASAGRNKPRVNEFVRCFGHVTTLVRRYMLFIAVVGGLVTSIAGLFLMLAGPCVLNQLKYYTITPLSLHAATKSTLNVVLLGDSLVMGSKYPVFDTVAARVSALLPHFHVTLHNLGVGGNGITAIKSRLPSVYATPADAVILLWDSDAYVLGDRETDDRLAQLQRVYESNVTYVVREIQRHKPGVKMALAGPILVGDGPWSLRYTVREYRVKAQQFDTYRDINRRLAAGTYRHDQRTWKPLFSTWHFLTKKSAPPCSVWCYHRPQRIVPGPAQGVPRRHPCVPQGLPPLRHRGRQPPLAQRGLHQRVQDQRVAAAVVRRRRDDNKWFVTRQLPHILLIHLQTGKKTSTPRPKPTYINMHQIIMVRCIDKAAKVGASNTIKHATCTVNSNGVAG